MNTQYTQKPINARVLVDIAEGVHEQALKLCDAAGYVLSDEVDQLLSISQAIHKEAAARRTKERERHKNAKTGRMSI